MLLALFIALSPPSLAADMGIAAVVGGDAISSYDIDNRVRFIIGTARLSNTPDVVERIMPQVLRSLIDEKLQLQEAARNGISVTEQEVQQAIGSIEQERNMPLGAIGEILDQNHVSRDTFTQQIHAQLVWNKLLMRKIRPQIKVSDEEIKLANRKMMASPAAQTGGPQELKIAVIALPVDKPARETEVRRLAEKLVKEVRGGASFEEVSRQFSSVAASSGGKVEAFWVRPEQLDPNVARVLSAAVAGTITDPVRTPQGYTILKVYEARALTGAGAQAAAQPPKDVQVNIKQILLKLKPAASGKEADALLGIGAEVARHPGTCEEKGIAGVGDDLADFDIDVTYQAQRMSELPPSLQAIAGSLKVGDISAPFASYEGIVLYMLCGRQEIDAQPIDRDRLYGMIVQNKMELEAQKYLRNLRRDTFIEIR